MGVWMRKRMEIGPGMGIDVGMLMRIDGMRMGMRMGIGMRMRVD